MPILHNLKATSYEISGTSLNNQITQIRSVDIRIFKNVPLPRSGDAELVSQFLSVIDPGPGSYTDLRLRIIKLGRFQSRWGCIPVDTLDQQDAFFFEVATLVRRAKRR